MSVIIKNISTSNNNDVVYIDGWIMYCGEVFEGSNPLISIVCDPISSHKNEWYFGNKDNGRLITDEEFKNFVVQGVEDYTKSNNSIFYKIRNSVDKENLN